MSARLLLRLFTDEKEEVGLGILVGEQKVKQVEKKSLSVTPAAGLSGAQGVYMLSCTSAKCTKWERVTVGLSIEWQRVV